MYFLNFDLKTVISDLENPPIYIFIQLDEKNLEFSQQWPPYLIRPLEFSIFDLGVVIRDRKNKTRIHEVIFDHKHFALYVLYFVEVRWHSR